VYFGNHKELVKRLCAKHIHFNIPASGTYSIHRDLKSLVPDIFLNAVDV
jgi:hypothetical protein